nr:hypothetical protein [uncultured Devosia sp.]
MTKETTRPALSNPDLKDVVPGSDADATPIAEQFNTRIDTGAAAMKDGEKPGPADAPVQVRPAGTEDQTSKPTSWDEVDEAVDESFPASDASAKY